MRQPTVSNAGITVPAVQASVSKSLILIACRYGDSHGATFACDIDRDRKFLLGAACARGRFLVGQWFISLLRWIRATAWRLSRLYIGSGRYGRHCSRVHRTTAMSAWGSASRATSRHCLEILSRPSRATSLARSGTSCVFCTARAWMPISWGHSRQRSERPKCLRKQIPSWSLRSRCWCQGAGPPEKYEAGYQCGRAPGDQGRTQDPGWARGA